jgi:hypothetical protein
MADDPLAAEIAAHRSYTAVKFSGGQGSHQLRCRKCGDEWPCLVRRLASVHADCWKPRHAVNFAVIEEAKQLRDERDALLAAGNAMADAINGYMLGTFTSLPMMEALVAWRALATADGGQPA